MTSARKTAQDNLGLFSATSSRTSLQGKGGIYSLISIHSSYDFTLEWIEMNESNASEIVWVSTLIIEIISGDCKLCKM
jgi:hypothetical protein